MCDPRPPRQPEEQAQIDLSLDLALNTAIRLWPGELPLKTRLLEVGAEFGHSETALAVEYAEYQKAEVFNHVPSTLLRWFRDGFDLEQMRDKVQAARKGFEAKQKAEKEAKEPKPQNLNPPAPIEPERPPTPEEIAEALETIRGDASETVRRLYLAYLNRWVMMGWVAPEVLKEFKEKSLGVKKKTGCGPSLERYPQPAGVQVPRPDLPVPNHTAKVCAGQETSGDAENGHCPPGDLNPERTD